jgi:hypothetical protein
MSFLNQIMEFCKVVASSVGGENTTTLYNLTGVGGFTLDEDGIIDGEDESDEGGEQAHEQECFGALGIIGRPLPPEGDLFAEALALRTDDGLVPYAFRDLRLHRAINASGAPTTPAEGQLMFVGYGGAFLSHSMTAENVGSKRANISALYVPYAFDSAGVAQKAHAIIIDPTDGNSSIQLIHGDGVRLTLSEETGSGPGIVAAIDGSTFLRMAAGELTLQAEKVTLKGNVYLGAAAETGLPLLAGVASPPSPSVFVSPV